MSYSTLKNTWHGSQNGNVSGGFIMTIKHPSPGSFIMSEWKNIDGFDGYYKINILGQVKSMSREVKSSRGTRVKKDRILKAQIRSNGYYMVTICKDYNIKHFCIHRLLANAFIPNPKNKPCINHKDGNKLNNNINNLEWCTHKENSIHAFKNKLVPSGEDHNKSKLSNAQVIDIRKSKLKQYELAEIYNMCPASISAIINNKAWRFI